MQIVQNLCKQPRFYRVFLSVGIKNILIILSVVFTSVVFTVCWILLLVVLISSFELAFLKR